MPRIGRHRCLRRDGSACLLYKGRGYYHVERGRRCRLRLRRCREGWRARLQLHVLGSKEVFEDVLGILDVPVPVIIHRVIVSEKE